MKRKKFSVMWRQKQLFFDDYLCLVALNKQQIQWTRLRKKLQKYSISGNFKAGADSSKQEVVTATKKCANCPIDSV